MSKRRSRSLSPVGGRRQKYLELAAGTEDLGLRDLYLATAEATTAKALRGKYGEKTQDPRDVSFGDVALLPQDDPLDEAYWHTGNLALSRERSSLDHGWSTTVDPAAGV